MDSVFKKLVKGTNFKSGPSSKVILFRDDKKNKEDLGHFQEEFKILDHYGNNFKDYSPLDEFSKLESLVKSHQNNKNIKNIIQAIESRFNFKNTTPIQKHTIPIVLLEKDVVAVAPTGSGKTLAYLIPILLNLSNVESNLKVLILVPTVELVQQVKSECVYLMGGENIKIVALEKNMETFECSIAISTPLTLFTLLQKHKNMLNDLNYLVLDEADKLLEEGYYENVEYLMNNLKTSKKIQKMCFSSTIQSEVLILSKTYFSDPIHITIGADNVCCCNVEQELICVTNDRGKLLILKQLLNDGKLLPPILIFLQNIRRVNELYEELLTLKLNVDKFTKELSVKQRQNIIQKFRMGEIWMLLCTDILSRGINFKGIHSIVNYDLPLTPQVYINRVGRAGRGLKRGKCVTFFTINDFKILHHIVHIMKLSKSEVPEYLLNMNNTISLSNLKKLEKHPPTRVNIGPIKRKNKLNKKKYNKNKRFKKEERGDENEEKIQDTEREKDNEKK